MSDLLGSTRGKAAVTLIGGAIMVAAAWFLLVAPQRSKANDLATRVSASQSELAQRRQALARPAAAVTVRPSDLYRLTKALPDDPDMPGILIDVDRLAHLNKLSFSSITPSAQIAGSGYTQQPLAIVVQGRFGNVSRFLGSLRRLVSVHGGRLDARGRLYSVSKIDLTSPDSPAAYPVVKAAVVLNSYSYANTPPPTASTSPQTTTSDSSSSGTVAAGANP
jgi:Tfp pilus assembly protein PilO